LRKDWDSRQPIEHSSILETIGEHCLIISLLSLDVIKRFIRALGRGFQMVFIKAAYYINQTEVHITEEFHNTIGN